MHDLSNGKAVVDFAELDIPGRQAGEETIS